MSKKVCEIFKIKKKEYENFKTQKVNFTKNSKDIIFKNVPAVHAYKIKIQNLSTAPEQKNVTVYCKEAFVSVDKQNLSDKKNDTLIAKSFFSFFLNIF
jgi:transcriptional regulator of NAD metabolism